MSDNILQGKPSISQAPGLSSLNRWTKGSQPACDRIHKGVVIPEWRPSFQLDSNAKVFAIGSCFARNIEAELLRLGVTVTSTDPNSDVMEIRTNHQLGLLNKYNPASIHQELEWAAGFSSFPEEGFIEAEGKYSDPYLRDQTRRGTLDAVRSRRATLQQYFAKAFEADLVIVTLGLTETWYDRTTKLALTEAPSPRLLKQSPERFGLKQLTYPECLALLKSICALLRKYGQDTLNIVFTVSPVALQRTFTQQDVIVANMQSKATLRAAVGDLVAQTSGVDYFPSYEAAMLSDPLIVWHGDRRNVTDFIVAHIIREFTHRYGVQPPQDPNMLKANENYTLQARLGMAQKNISALNHLLTHKNA